MGLGDWLRSLVSRSAEADPEAIYLYLRCSACAEVIRLRVDRQYEMSQDFEQGGSYVRKVAVGQRCFRPIEVELRLEPSGKEAWRSASGADFISPEEYQRERDGGRGEDA